MSSVFGGAREMVVVGYKLVMGELKVRGLEIEN
jgi:hypothetical protein